MNEINNKFEGNLSWDFKLNDFPQYDEDGFSIEPKMFFSSETIQAGEHNGKKMDWVVAGGLIRDSVGAYDTLRIPEFQKKVLLVEQYTNKNNQLGFFLSFKNASDILSGPEKLPVKLKITIDESSFGDNDSDEIVQKHVLETEYEFSEIDPCYFFSLKSSASIIKYLIASKNGRSVPVGSKPLQFKCKIKFHFSDQDFKCDKKNYLLEHLSSIDDEFSDFEIKVDETVFKKHKLILARCSYFRRLFATDMIESAQSSMEIEDFSPQIVSKMLEYLYTGQIIFSDDVSDDAGENLELHRIADKYEILDLKEGLQSMIAKSIQIENSCQIFKYSDGIGSKELKEKAIKFIVRNREAVTNTEGFKEGLKSSPGLLMELCVEISKIK